MAAHCHKRGNQSRRGHHVVFFQGFLRQHNAVLDHQRIPAYVCVNSCPSVSTRVLVSLSTAQLRRHGAHDPGENGRGDVVQLQNNAVHARAVTTVALLICSFSRVRRASSGVKSEVPEQSQARERNETFFYFFLMVLSACSLASLLFVFLRPDAGCVSSCGKFERV